MLSEDNKVRLIIPFIVAILAGFFGNSWFESKKITATDPKVKIIPASSQESSNADSNDIKTEGWCSPAVYQTDGNVTINCQGVSPKIIQRLQDLLDKRDLDLLESQKEVHQWLTKYNELKAQLEKYSATDERTLEAKALLEKGELEAVEMLFKKSLTPIRHDKKDLNPLGAKELPADIPKERFREGWEIPPRHIFIPTPVEIDRESPTPVTEEGGANRSPRFYIFHNGYFNGKLTNISLNWASMPKPVQKAEAIRPTYIIKEDSQREGHTNPSLKLYFLFDRYPREDMGITLLSEADCWGEEEFCNPSYNFSNSTKLVFSIRGERGDERVLIKAAFSTKQFGDSANKAIVYPNHGWLRLSPNWMKCEIDVHDVDLTRVITPFSISAQARNNSRDTVIIHLDEIYYQRGDPVHSSSCNLR